MSYHQTCWLPTSDLGSIPLACFPPLEWWGGSLHPHRELSPLCLPWDTTSFLLTPAWAGKPGALAKEMSGVSGGTAKG